ncbi:MAG TPA: P-loop NTPase [Rhizomicrobium sp.]
MTRLTAIGSGKGGTGKTLIAVSLAHAFAHDGERVLLCDADLGLSNAGVHLGVSETGDLLGMLVGDKPLEKAVVRIESGRAGFDLLAAPSGCGALANADDAQLARLIGALEAARHYDRVIIDLGAGVDNKVLDIAARADDVLLVVTPDPASLTDAYAFAKLLLRRTASRAPQILVNMALNATEGRRIADALMTSARSFLRSTPDYLGFIPCDPRVPDAVRRQSPLLTLFPQAPAATAIAGIARRLQSASPSPQTASGLR